MKPLYIYKTVKLPDVLAQLRKNQQHLAVVTDEYGGTLGIVTKAILRLLKNLNEKLGITVVIITHNASIAPLGNRLIRMRNGSVQEMTVNEHPAKVADITW